MSDIYPSDWKHPQFEGREKSIAGYELASLYEKILGTDCWSSLKEYESAGDRRNRWREKRNAIHWNLIQKHAIATCKSSPQWLDVETGRTALHIIVALDSPKHIVKRILELWPQAPMIQDNHGCTPLHYACQYNASPNIVIILLRAYRCAAQFHDIMGDTPLHLACDSPMVSSDIVQTLLEFDPHHVWTNNHNLDNKTPLDIMCDHFRSRNSFRGPHHNTQWKKLLLCLWASHHGTISSSSPIHAGRKEGLTFHACLSQQRCSSYTLYVMAKLYLHDSSKIQDEYGNYPLIYAVSDARNKNVIEDIIFTLLDVFPPAAAIPNACGQMPIHLAINSGIKWKSIHQLLSACPSALQKQDPETGLYPFMLAAQRKKEDLDMTYNLLRSNPGVLNML